MKTSNLKSVTMKTKASTTPWFSAYPLKAIKSSVPDSGTSINQSTKMIGRLRVLPMVNPYSEKKSSINRIKYPTKVESNESSWNNNFE
jgi:hypothetical protein